MSAAESWVPHACTLPTVEQPLRVREFDRLFTDSLVVAERLTPQRLRLTLRGGDRVAERASDLAARESECCPVFTFVTSCRSDRVDLEIMVPATHVAVLDALAERARQATA